LLEAVEILWEQGLEFELELIGKADLTWTPKVVKVIDELNKRKRPVKWLLHIDQDTLEEKYACCSFTVYPSLYEGFGLPILESLIRGKPCICGKNGALGEISSGGGCIPVEDQKDVNLLANNIKQLLINPKLSKKLIFEAQQRNFPSYTEYASRLLAFLLE
jgi:glycosyltransferase involved in cell wall biosynthesis